jgi:hypothetical protein
MAQVSALAGQLCLGVATALIVTPAAGFVRATLGGLTAPPRLLENLESAEHAFPNELRSGQEHRKDNQFLEGIGRNGVA